ncbi:Tyrosine-protein phosphatase non-receptor type 9 [Fasciolopsis buskii]|uniref:Tyrosine-protein phosphatase non-receptor type 9 n=1 Tax=Fasciolopsis buskii TaxID=27845 RepID=A0A8E0S2X0_9TREM|nr:Tyrosine-protein phosphatase non-receptor type 9 [Fasciolopsis buski]
MRYTENVDSIDPLEDGVRKELLSGKFTVLQPNPGDSDELTATIAIFTAHRHWPPLTTHRDTLKGVLYQLDIAMME